VRYQLEVQPQQDGSRSPGATGGPQLYQLFRPDIQRDAAKVLEKKSGGDWHFFKMSMRMRMEGATRARAEAERTIRKSAMRQIAAQLFSSPIYYIY
jgi:hypothetical protein